MRKKSVETILYSTAGVVVMLVLLAAVNVILDARPVRVDLTQGKLYTLSDGTKAVLKKITSPVTIHFYCTQSETASPDSVYLADYAKKVEDLLNEYREIAGRNLVIQKFDPQPNSDAEDSAQMDGLDPQQLPGTDNFYLGLSVGLADTRAAIPFLSPGRERLLEYDITRTISQVINPAKPTIGIMSALPVFGARPNPMMMEEPAQANGPWAIILQLEQDYNVRQIPMDSTNIDDDVKTLLVIHPADISDRAQFAIDQFVLRGGKLIAFLDPQSVMGARQQNPGLISMGGSSSSLDKLLKAWGYQFDTGKVVADLNFKMQLRGQSGQPSDAPAWLGLTPDGINRNDIVTSEMDTLWLPMAGAFSGEPVAGLKESVLLHSSKQAELADGFLASMGGGSSIMNGFKATGVEYKLAIRLTGKFPTAFPNGLPPDAADSDNTNSVATNAVASLKVSTAETSVVLAGDSDMLADDFSLRTVEGIFGPEIRPMNENLDFAQNLVEQFSGDNDLIGLRSRAPLSRPFTVIRKMEAEAEASGEAKIDQLRQSLSDTQQRLEALQQQRSDKDQRFILSPEQKMEIENFRKQQAEVSQQLKKAQKDLRKEVVSLEMRLTWLNILAMPLAVTLAGVAMALVKRKKTSAK
jgi:ABC-type uncharacterized transport system involved in gliding motility auxiliary subunit